MSPSTIEVGHHSCVDQIQFCSGSVEVSDCFINTNGSSVVTATLAMVKMTDVVKCQLTSLQVDDNTGQFDLRCFSLNNAIRCTLDSCVAKNNIAVGGGSKARGFFLEGAAVGLTATGNIFTECTVLNLTATSVTDGFLSDTNCDDNSFQNCLAANLMARDVAGVCHGYRIINNSRNKLRTCLAMTCTSLSTVAAPFYGTYGFKIDSSTSTGLTDCTASDNTAASITGRGVGFFWFQTNSATALRCTANRNTVGLDANNLTFNNQSFVSNVAQKNLTTQYSSAWPAGANDTVNNNNTQGSTHPWVNFGVI